ncbi:putative adhesin [Streptomyces mayteni]
MDRPADWSPVSLDSDPTPGEPDEVRSLADELQTFADDVGEALGRVGGMSEDRAVMDWAGLSAEAFRGEFDGVPGNLEKLQTSYDLAARALAAYWPKLETAQGMADRALDRAIAAQADLSTAQAALGDAQDWVSRAGREAERLEDSNERENIAPPSEAEVRAATRDRNAADQAASSAQGRVDAAQDALSAAQELARQAKEMREDAARVCADDLDEASDAGIRNRRWWEDAVHWVSENWDTVVAVCKVVVAVLGIVVMITGGPLAWVVLAAALMVLADTLAEYANGRASLWDVGFAALDCVPGMKGLTTLGGLAHGIRSLGSTGLRGMALGARGLGQGVRSGGRSLHGLFTRADPIDMATGEVVMSATDVDLPGVLPLVLQRHHRSSVRSGTWFGPSWSSTLDQRLVLDPDGVRLCAEDGMLLHYPRPLMDAPVLPVEGPRWALAWEAEPGGTLTVHQRETGRTLAFRHVPGRRGGELPLVAIADRNGNRIRVEYDASGAPTDVLHEGGYHVGVTTHEGRVTELRLLNDPDRPVLRRFGYDGGNLTEIYNSSGLPQRFDYDDRRHVTGWTDRNGTWYRYAYDDLGRCVGTEGTAGLLASTIGYDTGTRRTLFTDSLGHTTVYEFNDAFQPVTETDPLGHLIHRTFDRYDRPLTVTDPLGHTTTFGYDEHGDLTLVVRPDGREIRVTHNEFGQQTEVVEADGSRWRQEFDERGNLTRVMDPSGAATCYTYDARGRLRSETDPLGATTRFEPDAAGLPVTEIDPLGGSLTYRRDAFGRPVEVTDPTGATHRMAWTIEGSPLRSSDPLGGTRHWTWDAEGNCLTRTDENGHTTSYTYGAFDLPATEVGPTGACYTFTHDTELRVVRVTDPDGLTWDYTHDPVGRPTAETDFDGRTTRYAHDAAGRLVSRTNAAGQVVTFGYDASGLLAEKSVDGERTTFTFDPLGRVTGAVGPDVEVGYRRDALGRVLSETVNGATVHHAHDSLGRPTGRVMPSGHRTRYTYDAAGGLSEVDAAGSTIHFRRDAVGREIHHELGPEITLSKEWNTAGLPNRQAIASGTGPERRRSHRFHPNRLPHGVSDSRDGDTTFTLDAEGRVTAVDAPHGPETYRYDAAGNQIEARWPAAVHDDSAAGDRQYTGTRLTRAGRMRYAYDAAGRVVSRSLGLRDGRTDTWHYVWDAEDRLTGVVTPDGTPWRYRHDPFGRRVSKERLDGEGTVVERTDYAWSGSLVAEETTTERGNPRRRTRTWDYHPDLRPLAQTERVTAPQGEIDARFHAIVTGLGGAPAELVDETGATVWRARATLWGAHGADPEATTDTPLRFPGQYADQETGWHYNLHRHYDPATARYTSPDPLGLTPARNPVAYVPNPLTMSDPTGLAPYNVTPYRPRLPTGRPDGQLVFSGHGGFQILTLFRRRVVVPEGTSIAFYSPHGRPLTNARAFSVERGRPIELRDPAGNVVGVENAAPVEVFGPGDRIPNYTLYPPEELRVRGDPHTVSSPTRLGDLLQPNLGQVHWAACRNRII